MSGLSRSITSSQLRLSEMPVWRKTTCGVPPAPLRATASRARPDANFEELASLRRRPFHHPKPSGGAP